MKPIYEENEETLEIAEQISCHIPPHLHKSMELVSVTEGTLEIGVGTELYHMEKGDFALVFPELIHHYQVFNSESCKAIYALASPLLAPSYTKELQQFCPVNPIIPAQAKGMSCGMPARDISAAISALATPAALRF